MAISFATRISVPSDVLVSVLAGESVLLNLKSERYFGLDDMGTRIWVAITTSDSIQAAYDALLAEYDVEPERLRQELNDLIEKLNEHGLVEINGA
jgi:Coenzyme PQQ synthesis protein D (PqqD)